MSKEEYKIILQLAHYTYNDVAGEVPSAVPFSKPSYSNCIQTCTIHAAAITHSHRVTAGPATDQREGAVLWRR